MFLFKLRPILWLLFTLLITACSTQKQKIEVDPAFGAYISGYTSGAIAGNEPIRIILAQPYSGNLNLSAPLPDNLFSFSPKIDGQAVWIDPQTIHFIPAETLPGGTDYTARMTLSVLMEIEPKLESFSFQFQTIAQNFSVYAEGYNTYAIHDLSAIQYRGTVKTAVQAELSELQQGFSAVQNGEQKEMQWQQITGTTFSFTVENVQRDDKPGELKLQWDGKSLNSKQKGEEVIAIPALGDFKVMNTIVSQYPDQVLTIHFSDPIAEQSLRGIISIENVSSLSFTIDGNQVKVFPDSRINGRRLLTIDGAIENTVGKAMTEYFSRNIHFLEKEPDVQLSDSKTIMPHSDRLTIPFEAVSLKAVDVYVTKVFTNNILQFFQSNQLGNNSNITYVGRHIYRKHVDLRQAAGGNLHEWQQYHLDISDIVKADPGAIYNIELRYKHAYAAFECDDHDNQGSTTFHASDDGWTSDGTYFVDNYWNDYQYDWENMDNPCHPAFYSPYRSRSAITVIASDMGLTAKMGGDNELFIAINDLISTDPVGNVSVTVYDFQQQAIGSGKTNKDGFVMIQSLGKPFIVVAENGKSRSYLKVDEYSALSLSKFDVGGATVQEGIKGFIYAERGVWRPGDSLYLNFVIEDKMNLLPDRHPVQMELRNPRGQVVQQLVSNQSVNGFYDFRTATSPDAITGNYEVAFKVGNRRYNKRLKIETIKPNRLKINFEFDTDLITGTRQIDVPLEARWLHGANASNLKADVEMTVAPTKTTFSQWPNYHFDNNLQHSGGSVSEFIFDGDLSSEGRADISVELSNQLDNAPGIMKLNFHTKVYEPGGNFSEDFHSVRYSPYSTYVGMEAPVGEMWGNALETDQDHPVNLVVVDEKGEAFTRSKVNIKLYQLNRNWWYDSYNGNEFNFLNSSSFREVKSQEVTLSWGKGTYVINIPNNGWGRYVLVAEDPVSGHSTADFLYFDWPYWMRANRAESDASTILGFSSDKEVYAPGEKIKLTFPSSGEGRALVCIENGTRILKKFWVDTEQGETRVEIPVGDDMAPNVFAHIALLQPHAQTVNDRPMRLFGVIPLKIENPETRLHPEIQAPEVLRPETKATFVISEKSGQAMTYTLSIVDEGLLDLTRFTTPNAWDAFYAPEALGVRTWDMYDQVIGALGENIGTLLSIGGDEGSIDPAEQKAMRFKPMVRHLGPFTLKKGENARHEIDIPNYIGSVRAMVTAGMEPAFGNAEKAIPVRSPLMVLGTLPRVLGPGEQVNLPVNIFAMEDHVKNVTIRIKTNDLLFADGSSEQTFRFDQPGDELLMFALKTGTKTGVGKVTIEAVSGKEKSAHEIELDIRSPNPAITTVRDTVLFADDRWNANFEYFGIDGSNKAVLELSTLPAINLEKRLDFLIQYPHGCLEQITSGAFPQLYLHQLVSLSSERQMEVSQHVQEVLNRYRNYQQLSGGFSYWPGDNSISDWGTSYAGHLMLEAEAAGYAIPAGLKSPWLKYQQTQARQWASTRERNYGYGHRNQAYRLYTLAKANAADQSAMNLLRSVNDLHISARWILALAYIEAGQPEVAESLIRGADTHIPQYVELSYTFGSDMRDEAFVLLTLVQLKRHADAAQVAERLAKKLGSENWYSTQTTAFSIAAISAFTGGSDLNTGLQATVIHQGEEQKFATAKTVVQQPLSAKNGKGSVQVMNDTEQPLFARLLISGNPLEGKTPRLARNLSMQVRYLTPDLREIDPSRLKMGTDFIAAVTVFNPHLSGDLSEMALTQIFPSGWEILNPRMLNDDGELTPANYQDVRDDRVMTYFDIGSGRSVTFAIRLNATYAGRYYLPAVLCNAMYDERIIATAPGMWVEVIE